MREVELKAVLDQWQHRAECLTQAGAVLTFAGRLEDRRYDTPRRDLTRRDEVLRLRVYRDASGARAELGWKGPTGYEGGYKVRDELQCTADAPDVLATMLARLGYEVTPAIDREIAQYEVDGTTVAETHGGSFHRVHGYDIQHTVPAPDGATGALLTVVVHLADGQISVRHS